MLGVDLGYSLSEHILYYFKVQWGPSAWAVPFSLFPQLFTRDV